MNKLSVPSALGLVLALAGCASAPSPAALESSVADGPDCRQLASAIARTESARRAAVDKQADAWKAVVPFAVAARYANGKADAAEAGMRLDHLRTAAAQQGCDVPAAAKEQP